MTEALELSPNNPVESANITCKPGSGARAAAPRQPAPSKKSRRKALLTAGPLAVAAAALWIYLAGGRWVSTDDAYVKAAIVSVATDVSGMVAEVDVLNNQSVVKGQPLFKLDIEPFRLALDGANAQLALAANQYAALQASYGQSLQQVEQAKADLTLAQSTQARQNALAAHNFATQAILDLAVHDTSATEHRLIAAQAQAQSLLAQLGGSADLPLERYPQYLQAKAQAGAAARNLRNASVVAPADGVLANVDSLRPGNFLSSSQTALSLVSTNELWVEANLKETDLTYLKPGDLAEITVNSFPGHKLKAKVAAINPATGSEFSVLPAQNTSGNWVKVVQRLPVRLAIESQPGDPALRAGMSVTVDIDTGHKRSLSTLFGGAGS